MLAFDLSGDLYTLTSDESSINIYSIGPSYAATLVRSISPAGGGCISASADAGKNLYVSCKAGVLEFSPGSSNGDIAPVASNANAVGPVAVDASGALYAQYCTGNSNCVVGIWPSGTFGSGAPPSSLPEPNLEPPSYGPYVNSLAVDLAGGVYEIAYIFDGPGAFWYLPKGTTTPINDLNGVGETVVAPLR
jgi:hypothetical protein